MGKIFKRIVSLLLGSILGISSILATVLTSAYYMYSELPVGGIIAGENDDTLGALGDMSIEDIIAFLNKGTEAPENFTIADLRDKYGFDIIGLINGLGGSEPIIDPNDKQFLADIESLSVFKIFTEEGLSGFLSDLPVGVVLGFIPEETLLSKAERDKLRSYSVGQLIATNEATGELGIMSAIGEVKLGGVFPSLFEDGDMDGNYTAKGNSILNLVANVEFGGIIDVVTKKSTIGEEIVEGGLSDIGGMTVGDIMENVMGEGNQLAGTLNNLFNGMQIKDMFEKDVATGEYKFVEDKLLDNIKVGAVLGYEKDEDGVWHEKGEDGELGKPVTGLLEEIASLDLTTLYHVITGEGTASEKIHDILLVVGDLSVGDVFETLGYTKDGDEWLKKDGTPVESELLKVLFDISIEDIVGEAGTELSGTNIRQNLVNALISGAGDLTVGEGLGELFGVELNEDGKFVYVKGAKAGEEVNPFMANLLNIKVADVVESFGGEKVDVTAIVDVFERALAGTNLGELLGAEKINGKWFKDDQLVDGFVAILYDLDFAGLFSALKQLQSDDFSYASIIESFFPELKVADIVNLIVSMEEVEAEVDGTIVSEYYYKGQAVQNGLNTILNLKLWEVVAGFDKNHPFNLKAVIKDIPLGEVLNCIKTENGWKITDQRTLTGAISELFDFTLGDILSDEEGATKDKLIDTLKRITLGDVFTLALGYDAETGKFASTKEGEVPNRILVSLCGWDMSINDIINIVKGETKVDATFIRGELTDLLGGIPFGEAFRGFVTDFDEEDNLTITVLPELSGVLDPIFNTDWKFYIDLVFDIVDGKKLDVVEVLSSIYGDTTLGDFVAPIIKLERKGDEYVLSDGKSLGVAITGFLDMVIVDVVEVFVKGEGDIISKLDKLLNEKIINVDFMLGEYLTMVTGHKYEDGKWIDKNGKEVYEPLADLLSVNILEAVNTLLLDKSVTKEEKRDYLIDIFDGLTIKDVLDIIPAIKNSEKALIKKVGDVRIDNLIRDLFAEDAKILEIVDSHLGTVALGNIVDLIMVATESGDDWLDKNGNEYPLLLECVFGVTVSDIIRWINTKPFPVKGVITEVLGEITIADVVKMFVKLEDATNVDGWPVYALNGKGLPLIVSDIFNLSVNEIIGWTDEKDSKKLLDTIITGVFGGRTFGDHMSDIGVAQFDKSSFKVLHDTDVAEFINGLLKADNKLEHIKPYIEGIYIGHLVGFVLKVDGEEGAWTLKEEPVKAYIGLLFDIQIGEIINWIEKHEIRTIVTDLFGDVTFGTFFEDIGLDIFDKHAFDSLRDEKVADFIIYIIDRKFDEIKRIAGPIRVGDLANLVVNAIERNDEAWVNGDKALPHLLSGLFDVCVTDVVNLIDGKFKPEFISPVVAKINGEYTVIEHVENILNNDIKNNGVDKILGFKLSEMLDVMLGVKTDVKENMTKDPKIDYILNITDNVFFGDFMGYEKSEDGVWANANGEATGIMKTVVSIPVSYVLYAVAVVVKPALIKEAAGNQRIGTLIKDAYNKFDKIDSEIVGDNDAGYVVNGAYKFLMEDLANKTVGQMYDSVFENKTVVKDLKEFFLNRPIGDYLFDTLGQFVLKGDKGVDFDFDGYGADHFVDGKYVLEGDFADVISAVFNLNVQDLLGAEKKVDYVKELFADILIGDILYDVMDIVLKDDNKFGIVGSGYANTAANGGKYELSKSVLLETLFNVNVIKLLEEKDKVQFVKDTFASIYVGDIAALVLDVTGTASVWMIKGNDVNPFVGDIFDIQIGDVIRWLDEKPIDVKAIIDEVFGERVIADAVKLAVKLEVAENVDGITVYALNGKGFPLIVSDIFNISVGEIISWTGEKDSKKLLETVVTGVLGGRTFGDHMSDIGVEKFDKASFETLHDADVAVFVNGLIKADNKLDYVKPYVEEIFVGDLLSFVLKVDGVKGDWTLNDKPTVEYIEVLFDIQIGEILNWIEKRELATVVKDVFDNRTFNDFFEELNVEIIKKKFFDGIRGAEVATFVTDLLDENRKDKLGYVLSYFEKAYVGDAAALVLKVEGDKGAWLMGDPAEPAKAVLASLFDVQIKRIIEWKDTKDLNILDVIDEVFGSNAIVDFVDLVAKTKKATRESGAEVWALGESALPLIVSDVLDVEVGEIISIINDSKDNEDKNYVIKEVVRAITGTKVIEAYTKDLKLDIVSEKVLFKKLRETQVAVFVADLLDATDKLDNIISYFENAYVGDVVSLVAKVDRKLYNDNMGSVWLTWSVGDPAEDAKKVLASVFNVQIKRILEWKDTKDLKILDVVDEVFGKLSLIHFVELFAEIGTGTRESGIEVLTIKDQALPLIASDVLAVKVGTIIDIINDGKDNSDKNFVIKELVKAITSVKNFEIYAKDLKLDIVTEQDIFRKFRETQVAVFVAELLDATDKVDYVLSYFKSAKIGAVASLLVKDLHEESERVWYVGEKAMKLIVSDLLSLEIGSILDWVKTISEKETVSEMVHSLADGRTVLAYVEDLLGKDIDNNGVDKLLSLKVTDIVDVILGLKEAEKENITKDKKIDFFLNHTDEIMIGEFLKGYTYDSEEEKWADANGNVANDTMQAVLKAPVSYVIYLIAVIVKPELIVDAIGDQRIGTLIKEPYNKIEKIDSEIVGDNDAGYVVDGAFKAVMEDFVNLTVEEIYNWSKDKKLKTELESRILDRNLGDYLYDVIVQFVYKEDKLALDLEGFASEKTDADGNYHLIENYARLLNKVFNLNVKETIDGLKAKNGWVDEFIKDVYLGDILFDLVNSKMGEKLNFTGETYAIDNTTANGDKYVLERNFKDVLEVVFNISLYDLTKAKNIVDFAKEKASSLVVGDIAFDLSRKFLNDKLNLQITGTFACVNKAENGGVYSFEGNFKDVLDVLFNINVVELINADKKDEFLKEKTADLLVGDVLFDPIRKLFNAKYNLGLEEKFAWENKAENGGKYFASENASEVLTRTFNIKLGYVYSYILEDKAINMFLHDFYSSLTLGDLAYDLTRKFVAEKLALEMRGFAWQYKANEMLMTGKLAKLFRSAFSITLDDLYQVAKKRTTVKEFLTDKFGQLDLGETVAPFVEVTLEKALDLTYVYDKANDYELTVEGNFAELVNAIFGVKLEGIINNKDLVKFLLGEGGALENMPVGHLVGYLTKVKSFKSTFKYTTVTHVYDGEWIITGAYSVPMDILCNDLTFGEVYANRKKLKNNIIIPYFGEVAVGQLMGGNVLDGVWYKPNGKAIPTHGAKNVIMNAVYDLTVDQLLAKNFDPTTVIEDIYAGQLMSYYYCGEFKYSKVESDDYGLCEDETHVDGVDGYHVHFECEIENDDHDHADMGDGWYVLENGKYEEVGAIENAVANLRLKVLMEGRFSMAEALADVKLGSAMNLVYCDGTSDCEILEDSASHVCDAGWYKVETVNGVEVYTKEKILIQKISDVNMKELFTNGLDLETTFAGTMIGDVLGYAHCYVDAEGNRVCDEALGHGDLDHKTRDMWYIFDEEDGAYRKATPLERTMASVAMSSIVNGKFDVEETLENITLGEFMSYEKCTGDENCFIHDDHTDPNTYVANAWYKEGASGYERVTDNLALAIADFTIKNMQDSTFIDQVLTKIKAQVTIGDIFGETDGTPLSLLPEDTTIGNINSALTDTFKTSTAGDMYNAGVLPFDGETFNKMDDVYGSLVMTDCMSTAENDQYDRIATKYHPKRDAAIAAAGTEVAPTDPGYDAYVHMVGEYFWMSLTANELVDILINAVHV